MLVKLRESPFYPEGGGQVSDVGTIETDSARAGVEAVHRLDGDQALTVRLEHGELRSGERVRARVEASHRRPTVANHTGTHLLHRALRNALGDHVRQAGSLVRPDRLRFDFTHPKPMTAEELKAVEDEVNQTVVENRPVRAYEVPIDEARTLGATMLFGEKYGDIVRVVDIDDYSRELCGGTHARSTAEVGPFKITRESSVAQGVRRIEAVTNGTALNLLRGRERAAEEAAHAARTTPEELPQAVAALTARVKELEKAARSGGVKAAGGADVEAFAARAVARGDGLRVLAAEAPAGTRRRRAPAVLGPGQGQARPVRGGARRGRRGGQRPDRGQPLAGGGRRRALGGDRRAGGGPDRRRRRRRPAADGPRRRQGRLAARRGARPGARAAHRGALTPA